ncbi:hypothetical protein D9M73_175270 [compost metagenome]
MAGQVLGEAVGDGDGATGQEQFHGHGSTNDVRGADDHGVHAVQVLAGAFEQGDDAFWRARAQQRDALGQAADVIRVETVHVLVRADALQQFGGIQVLGQGQLQQDAVDVGIIIEAVDQARQFFLGGGAGQVEGLGKKADFFTVFALVRDIDLGGGVGADQDHCQARRTQALLATLHDTLSDLLAQTGGDCLAID